MSDVINEQITVNWKYIHEPNHRTLCHELLNGVCIFIHQNYLTNADNDERKKIENELRGFLRIVHIMNALLVCNKESDMAMSYACVTKEHYSKLFSIIKNMEYKSPWDGDNLTHELLGDLCAFLSIHFPDNEYFLDACNTPITHTNFKHEVNKLTYGIP